MHCACIIYVFILLMPTIIVVPLSLLSVNIPRLRILFSPFSSVICNFLLCFWWFFGVKWTYEYICIVIVIYLFALISADCFKTGILIKLTYKKAFCYIRWHLGTAIYFISSNRKWGLLHQRQQPSSFLDALSQSLPFSFFVIICAVIIDFASFYPCFPRESKGVLFNFFAELIKSLSKYAN